MNFRTYVFWLAKKFERWIQLHMNKKIIIQTGGRHVFMHTNACVKKKRHFVHSHCNVYPFLLFSLLIALKN